MLMIKRLNMKVGGLIPRTKSGADYVMQLSVNSTLTHRAWVMPKLLDNFASLMDSQELRDVKRLVSLLKISQTGGMSRI